MLSDILGHHEGGPNSFTGRTQANKITQINLDVVGRSHTYWGDPVSSKIFRDQPMSHHNFTELLQTIRKIKNNGQNQLLWQNFQHVWLHNFNDICDLPEEDLYEVLWNMRRFKFTTPIITQGWNMHSLANCMTDHWAAVSAVIIKTPVISEANWCQHYNRSHSEYRSWIQGLSEFGRKFTEYGIGARLHIWITGIDRFTADATPCDIIQTDVPDWQSELSEASRLKHQGLLSDYIIGGMELRNHCNQSEFLTVRPRPRHECGRLENLQGMFTSHTDLAIFGIRNRNILNIASNGDCYVCQEDIDQKYVYGNVFENDITDIWFGDLRQQKISEMMANRCNTCQFAI